MTYHPSRHNTLDQCFSPLVQRRRRWSSIKPTVIQRLVSARISPSTAAHWSSIESLSFITEVYTAINRKQAVSAYFISEQMLSFGFAE